MKKILLLLCSACIQLHAQICFNPKVDYSSLSGGLIAVIAIDLNHDNHPEVISANSSSKKLSVFPCNANGTFNVPSQYAVNSSPEYMCSGDFNNDGNPDLALTYSQIDSFSIFPGNGSGGFGPKSDFAVSPGPKDIASADFNNDGKQDLAIATGMNTVDVLMGNGTGGFSAPASFPVMNGPVNVVITDFNNDSKTDIIVNNLGDFSISLLAGDGTGNFAPAVYIPTNPQPSVLKGADVNNDGNIDLVLVHQNTGLSLLLGNGAGNFSVGPAIVSAWGPRILLSDLDNDGAPDLVISRGFPIDSLKIMKNDGAGHFTWVLNQKTASGPYGLCSADFNSDGKADLAVAGNFVSKISVLLNCSPVGLEKDIEENSFSFYPNPASDMLHLLTGTADEYSIEIRDLNGRSIRKEKIRSSITLDISGLNEGVYILSLQGNGTNCTKKLVVLH
jgi:hypothetical protein